MLFILLLLLSGWLLGSYLGAMAVTYPNPEEIEERDSIAGFVVEDVQLTSSDNTSISAWLVPNDTSDRAVIILTGIRGNRTSNIKRAELYLKKGYTVLLPDLRGTGASGGDVISFGWNERQDLKACYDLLVKKGYKKISAHGQSLGAATIAYSINDNVKYDLVVLESCYDNIDHAFRNRVGNWPKFVLWPMYFFTEWRIGAKAEQLYPEECLKKCNAPVLYFAGDSEKQVKLEETETIFENIASADKTLHIFEGAEHEDFMTRYEAEYIQALDQFLDKHVQAE
jgi:alpha-beta hydrolase superfamily lysophospholipase